MEPQNNRKPTLAAPRRILIVRLGSMGDIIHALPAAAALHERFPDCEIDWLVESRWRELLEGNPCLARVVAVDTLAWRKQPLSVDVWSMLRKTIMGLQERRYDYALDLQAALKSAVACRLSGAREIIGFERPWLKEAAGSALYTRRIKTHAAHIVDANLALAAALGAALSPVRFPLPTDDATSLPAWLPGNGYAVLNPGAGWRSKCWPPEHFASLADTLADELALPSVLNCGPGEEPLAQQVQQACRRQKPPIYSGNLKGLMALLRRSRLMVGPDTGPLHLAAALGVPTVGLFGPTDPGRNGPYGRLHRTLRPVGVATSYKHSSEEGAAMRSITPEKVMHTIRELLKQEESIARSETR